MTRTFHLHSGGFASIRLDLERDLNDAQRAAVTCGEGPKLVIAGAGSGKTRTITYRVAYLMAKGLQPSQILLATFTNKAAREMLSRVEALTGSDVGKVWGGTFHAIGNRLLRQFGQVIGLKPNYTILDEEDQRDLLKVCMAEAKIKIETKRFPSPAVLGELISFAFNAQQPIGQIVERRYPPFAEWTAELVDVARRYEAKKRSANAVDYDDLLGHWLKLLEEHPELARRFGGAFRALLVDEYQDTNAIQARIIERMAEQNGRNLMVVGDDAQSIYRFRGANYDNILRFPERNPGTELFKLEVNYRSTPQILAFTNASILHNEHQYRKQLIAQRPGGLRPVIVPVNDIYQEAAFVAERILQLRDEGCGLEDLAVLYRAHAHSSILQAELIRRNIPYEVRSGVRFFEQAHIKDVVAHLKVLDNPFDEIAWRRLWLMLPRVGNVTAARLWQAVIQRANPLDATLEPALSAQVQLAARPAFTRFQHDLRALRTAAAEDAAPAALVQAVLDTSYPEYLRTQYESAASRLEDIQQLGVFARSYRSLRSFLSELVLLGELYGQEVAASSADQERLVLSSVHQAKGLEWRAVFLLRMAEGSFPSDVALGEEGGEEEERRVFYVATTRAKDELYITYPLMDLSLRGNNQLLLQPSRFLREIDAGLSEQGQVAQEMGSDGVRQDQDDYAQERWPDAHGDS